MKLLLTTEKAHRIELSMGKEKTAPIRPGIVGRGLRRQRLK